MIKRFLLLHLFLCLGCLLGCSSSSSSPSASPAQSASSPSPAAAPGPSDIKRVDAANFSYGSYLPPLDGGRIELAPPEGWRPMPRSNKYVVRFQRDLRSTLPKLRVSVEAWTDGGMSDATEANVSEFAKKVFEKLESKGLTFAEPPLPMVIGDVPCARYVTYLNVKSGNKTIPAEREALQVLKSGRVYTIELLYLRRTLKQLRGDSFDPAYALCASMKFLESNTEEPATEPK